MNVICGLLLSAALISPDAVTTPDTARAIICAEQKPFTEGLRFKMTGQVILETQPGIALADQTGIVFLNRDGRFPVSEGDRVCATGDFTTNVLGQVYSRLTDIKILSNGSMPRPTSITPDQFRNGTCDLRFVQMKGFVKDVFADDIDLNWTDVILQCERETILVSCNPKDRKNADLRPLIGRHIRVHGVIRFFPNGGTRPARRVLIVSGIDAFEPLGTSASSPFDVPSLSQLAGMTVEDIQTQNRHRTSGRVIAVWQGRKFLLRNAQGLTTEVTLLDAPPPSYGSNVEASGFPTTDSYYINLEQAVWRPCQGSFPPEDKSSDISPDILLVNEYGDPGVNARYHGRTVRLSGTVIDLSERDGIVTLGWESTRMTVDASHVPEAFSKLSIGCRIQISGICRMSIGSRRTGRNTPHDKTVSIILRTPSDLTIVSRPPWWTPGRLLALLGLLAAALLGVIGWNVSLNRRAKAKGRELAAEQLAHVTSELKVNERTRLAVELHDALSQTLTGVSMQIDTAAGFAKGNVPTVSKCLAIASRTIDACRMELRNTLWDLRSAALDEPSMDAAIRKTLRPNLAGIDFSVRFNVVREVFSDNTAHAVLKIIRELATNSIRHGHATAIKIAGTIDDGKLLFSVSDNGCGFDPDLAPGIAQGHFGLQGISERLARFNGEMKIRSTPGKGAKVTVLLPIPCSGE